MMSLSRGSLSLVVLALSSSSAFPAATPEQAGWKALQAGIREKNVERRARAVRALGLLPGDPKAVVLAEHALEDEKPKVRAAAATALGEINSQASIPKLRTALSDNDASVVLAAAASLVTLKDKRGYEIYYDVLTGERKTGKERATEGHQLLEDPKRMTELGLEEGIGFIPFGGLGMTAFGALTKNDVAPVRAAAARLLSSDPNPRSGEALARAVGDRSPIVRAAALEAIANRGDPALISDIQPALSDGDYLVRYEAAATIIRLSRLEKEPGQQASLDVVKPARKSGL
jgi:HEAT repeat protein